MEALQVPQVKNFIISDEHKSLLEYVHSMTQNRDILNILIRGKSGCGKSELVAQYAAKCKLPLATLEVGMLSESKEIFGYKDLENGKITYVPGLFLEAIQTPNAVVHLQELNRPESDKALNAIFSVLDDTHRSIWIDDLQRTVRVAEGVTFFATLNEGYEFIGTMPLDQALEGRFNFKISLDYLPLKYEKTLLILRCGLSDEQASNICSVASILRHNPQDPIHVSTRDLINIAKLLKVGAPLDVALKSVIATDEKTLESVLLTLHLGGQQMEDVSEGSYGLF